MGAPVVVPFRFSLLHSFLVVGISQVIQLWTSLFLYLHVRGDSLSVRAVVPGRDGGSSRLQGVFLFPPTMDFALDDQSVCGGSC